MKWFTKLPFVVRVMIGGIGLIAIVTLGFCIWTIILLETRNQERQENWERRMASPINEEVVEDLCNRELIPIDIADCEDPDVVVPYGSIPDIVEANIDFKRDTHDDVTSLFGQYEYCQIQLDCSDGEEGDTYRCDYSLHSYDFFIFYDCVTHGIVEVRWDAPGDS